MKFNLWNAETFTDNDSKVMAVIVIEEKISDGAWENIATFPMLNLEGNESPWELDEAYRRWTYSCIMAAAGVTCEFATFVREMFKWGDQVFRDYIENCTMLFPPPPYDWNIPTKNAEAKMLTYTYAAISEEVQTLFYNNKTNSGAFCLKEGVDTPTSLICVATILHHINPGWGANQKRSSGIFVSAENRENTSGSAS